MEYTQLKPQDFIALRNERIATLEGEHFRLALRLCEETEPDVGAHLVAQQAEIERRIALHTPPQPEAAVKDSADAQT